MRTRSGLPGRWHAPSTDPTSHEPNNPPRSNAILPVRRTDRCRPGVPQSRSAQASVPLVDEVDASRTAGHAEDTPRLPQALGMGRGVFLQLAAAGGAPGPMGQDLAANFRASLKHEGPRRLAYTMLRQFEERPRGS